MKNKILSLLFLVSTLFVGVSPSFSQINYNENVYRPFNSGISFNGKSGKFLIDYPDQPGNLYTIKFLSKNEDLKIEIIDGESFIYDKDLLEFIEINKNDFEIKKDIFMEIKKIFVKKNNDKTVEITDEYFDRKCPNFFSHLKDKN